MVGCQSVIMWLLRCSEVFLACYYAVARVFWIVGRVLLCVVLSVLTWLCSYKGFWIIAKVICCYYCILPGCHYVVAEVFWVVFRTLLCSC